MEQVTGYIRKVNNETFTVAIRRKEDGSFYFKSFPNTVSIDFKVGDIVIIETTIKDNTMTIEFKKLKKHLRLRILYIKFLLFWMQLKKRKK